MDHDETAGCLIAGVLAVVMGYLFLLLVLTIAQHSTCRSYGYEGANISPTFRVSCETTTVTSALLADLLPKIESDAREEYHD